MKLLSVQKINKLSYLLRIFPKITGFGFLDRNERNGARHGTFSALLKNPKHPKNLVISKYSQAIKVINLFQINGKTLNSR